jgi:propionyl-CoA carboxylase beta chain
MGAAAKRAEWMRRLQEARDGSATAIERQHARGKLTARERLDLLLDPGSFNEIDTLARHRCHSFGMDKERPYGDGVVTGYGAIDGRHVCVFAHDFTVLGGSLGEVFGEKVVKIMDLALKIGCPIIGINDSGGARIQEGVASLALYGEVARRNVMASGVIPQISMIMGPCAGGAVYSPAITDFIVMVEATAHMFVTGPEVVRAATGQDVTADDLGGADMHGRKSGVVHHVAADEPAATQFTRELLGYLPSNNLQDPPEWTLADGDSARTAAQMLESVLPAGSSEPYDIKSVIEGVLDADTLLEIQPLFAPNIVCAFGRLQGLSVGIVANQPMYLAGALDVDASEKAARFIRTCDAFNVPILTFVDVPGFYPSVDLEWSGIIRRGAKLAYAYIEAVVPKVTVITRKAYGGGYGVMGSKHLGADLNFAWPTAEIAVMGGSSAVGVLYRRQLAEASNPALLRAELTEQYDAAMLTPYAAADRGYIDAIVSPSHTRGALAGALQLLRTKRVPTPNRRHGNIPL